MCVYTICDEQRAATLQNEKQKLFNITQLSCWTSNPRHTNLYYKSNQSGLYFVAAAFPGRKQMNVLFVEKGNQLWLPIQTQREQHHAFQIKTVVMDGEDNRGRVIHYLSKRLSKWVSSHTFPMSLGNCPNTFQ